MKHKPKDIKAVKLKMFKNGSWLNVKSKKKDTTCSNCGVAYEDQDDDIALATREGKTNVHMCHSCGIHFIEQGADDLNKKHEQTNKSKDFYKQEIMKLDGRYKLESTSLYMRNYSLKNKSLDDLKEIHEKLLVKKQREERIKKEIEENYVDTPTDAYLTKIDNFYEDKEALKHPELIPAYFKDCGYEFFDCGQGYYEDVQKLICKIGDKYYTVKLNAEINSSKQDRGDRLYWVEGIESVTYQETVKPSKDLIPVSNQEIIDYLLQYYPNQSITKNQMIELIKDHIRNEAN